MAGVWMTPCKNGQCEISVRRDGINKIIIGTQTPLNDEQAEELFWCVGAMLRSGKTLKDLLKEREAVEPYYVNTNYEQHWKCGNCNAVISVQDKYCSACGKPILWEGR